MSIEFRNGEMALKGVITQGPTTLTMEDILRKGESKSAYHHARQASRLADFVYLTEVQNVELRVSESTPLSVYSPVISALRKRGIRFSITKPHVTGQRDSRNPTGNSETTPDNSSRLKTLESELGPYYSIDGVMARTGLSHEEIRQKMDEDAILGLETTDKQVVFPAFQFVGNGEGLSVLTGLNEIASILAKGGAKPTLISAWLITERPEFAGQSAVDLIRVTGDVPRVVHVAEKTAKRWQR